MLATQSQLLIRLNKKPSGRYYKQLRTVWHLRAALQPYVPTYLLYGSVCYDMSYVHSLVWGGIDTYVVTI
jgi:hypothetical protein